MNKPLVPVLTALPNTSGSTLRRLASRPGIAGQRLSRGLLWGGLIAALTIPVSIHAQAAPTMALKKAIVGHWRGYQPMIKDSLDFEFARNMTGRTVVQGTVVQRFTYSVNDKTSPAWLDITVGNNDGHAIVQMISGNAMRIRMYENGVRPSSFVDGADEATVEFRRVE